MKRFTPLLAAAALAAAGALAGTAHASAATCPTQESFFGTITRVSGNMLNVTTENGHGAIVRVDSGARINANGFALRSGTFLGAYGCVTPNGVFHASELTLSGSASAYHETLSGVVDRVQSGRLIVRQNGHGYGSWYVPDAEDFSRGQTVTGVGMIARSGEFYPQTVNGRSVAFDADNDSNAAAATRASRTITLTGVVQRVRAGSLLMWEPAQNHSGTWVVSGASRFRVGQRLVGTGTEDTSGRFYPASIQVR